MQIIDNRALLFVTKKADQITALIPKSKVLERSGELAKVLVNWGHDEAKLLRNMQIKDVPHPITGRYKWAGVYTPFTHQRDTAGFLATHQRCLVLSEAGTGKTAAAAWAADYLMQQREVKRVLIVCPVSIMDTAWRADLFRTVMHRTVAIASGSRDRREKLINGDYEFVIINFDGVKVVREALEAAAFDLIIADECFVTGTKVLTPSGDRAIETLKNGDFVLTSCGPQRIKTTVRNTATVVTTVELSDGQKITCTPDHPFFTDVGWVAAKNLSGRRVILASELQHVRGPVQRTDVHMEVAPKSRDADWADLLPILRSEEIPPIESRNVLLLPNASGAARHGYRHSENRGVSPANVRDAQSEGVPASGPGRQRDGHDPRGEIDRAPTAQPLGMELPRSVGEEAARLSYELQARLCKCSGEGGFRGGRCVACNGRQAHTGRQERSEVSGVWVARVSNIEREGGEPVFNLEVEGAPNYFVGGGVLVHNCTALKNTQTDRWKALNSLLKPATRLWLMTGTPASQSPVDAYGLAKLVSPDRMPRFVGTFRDSVMYKITQYKWAPKRDAQDIVFKALQPAIRYTKAECLDLPDLLYTTREVPLTAQQQKYYDAIKKSMVTLAAGAEITAVNAAGLLNKLLQISQGVAYTTDKEVVEFDVSNRIDELDDVIQQTTRKVIVFIPFRHAMEKVQDELSKRGYSSDCIHGGVPAPQRAEIIKRFQTEASPRIILLIPQAAAHGITLTKADTVVWWGPTPSAEMYLQGNARAHRAGQTNKVTVVRLQGSPVERRMYDMLDGKVDMHQGLVDLYKQELA